MMMQVYATAWLIGCQHPYGMLELFVHVAHCMYLYEQYHDLLLSFIYSLYNSDKL